jgi:hypothetical protein
VVRLRLVLFDRKGGVEFRARDDFSAVQSEVIEDSLFAGGQFNRGAIAPHGPGAGVNDQAGVQLYSGSRPASGSTDDHAQTREQCHGGSEAIFRISAGGCNPGS